MSLPISSPKARWSASELTTGDPSVQPVVMGLARRERGGERWWREDEARGRGGGVVEEVESWCWGGDGVVSPWWEIEEPVRVDDGE